MKLKLLASEPDSTPQADAKAAAYKTAEALEAHLTEELERITPPQELALRYVSLTEWLFGTRYEHQRARFGWWILMGMFLLVFFVGVIALLLGSYLLVLARQHGPAALTPQSLMLLGEAVFSWYFSIEFRRSAYGVVIAAGKRETMAKP